MGLPLVKIYEWGTQWYHFYNHSFVRLKITIYVALASASEVLKKY